MSRHIKANSFEYPTMPNFQATCFYQTGTHRYSSSRGQNSPQPEQAAHAHHPALDVRDYLQHDLDDEPDPEVREMKRQENVRTTLRMIDDALKYSR